MKATRNIAGSIAGAVLLVSLVAAVSFRAFGQIQQAADTRAHVNLLLNGAGDLLTSLLDAETGMRGFALTGDEAFLEPYLRVQDTIGERVATLRRLTGTDPAGQHLEAAAPVISARMAEITRVVELERAGDHPAALARIGGGVGKRLMDTIRVEVSGFVRLENAALARQEAEFQSSMRGLFAVISLASLCILLLALACAYFIYCAMRDRLTKALHVETLHSLDVQKQANAQLQQAIATAQASEAKLAVTFNSIGDAVIATDAAGRVTILNPLAQQLTGWAPADALNRPVEEIFHIFNSDTREPATIPVAATLAHGTIHGLANHTVLVAVDGSECAIADSCAPILDAAGQVIGAVLVFRDVTREYAAQQALRDGAELIQTILNTVVDGVVTLRANGGSVETMNPAAERMFGYAAGDVVGQNFSLLIPELNRDQRNGSLEYYGASDEARAVGLGREVVGRRKDGSAFPLEITVSEMRLGGERYFTGILREITARKRAEEALLKAGALQSAIFNSANFSSIATDAKGVIQIFNVGAERMLGYTADEVMNTITPAEISDPQEIILRATALSLEFGTPITPGFEALVFKASRGIEDIYELTYFRKDGSRFPAVVSVTALRDAQDAIIGYLLIGTDNTARKQIEDERMKLDQRVRDQHFYTRSLIESNIDALMTTDPRGIITDVNKQMMALTGCTRDELIGAPFRNYFTDAGRAEAGINRVLREGTVTNYELTARARDGKETVVSYNASTFHDRDRRLQGVFAAARDVTELKLFEQALRQKNAELEDASRMKSEFLANMSHELRTPLNAIIGFSEVLRDGLMGEMTEKQRGFIGDIFSSGKHLLALINDILDLSKVEAGKMTLDLEPVPVSSLLVNSLAIVREKAASGNIRLEMDEAEDLGTILADARKVKQIVYNLLSNAVKFTAEGGQVTLRTARVPRSAVGALSGSWTGLNFALADSGFTEFFKLSVTDSGIGISDDGLERLFKPFSQVDSGLARKFEGTGLGLAMVKLLVELHGGTVAVESAEGQGSCFTVWLPLRPLQDGEPAAVTAPAASRLVAAPAGIRTALVVEDDYKSADLIRVQLEAEGFTVLHAASAEAALVLAVEQPLSLITLDIMLPTMDGWEFLTRIKRVPKLARIPVVIISIAADRNKGYALGAAAVMQKPISRQELYESLVDLGLFPVSQGQAVKVLVVDDDPTAVELIAVRIMGLASATLRAYGGRDAIDLARRELPDLIVLDLMMPEVNGFDVVEALQQRRDTAAIPIIIVTARQITVEDEAKLNLYVTAVMEKAEFDSDRFVAEVRRAMSGRKGPR